MLVSVLVAASAQESAVALVKELVVALVQVLVESPALRYCSLALVQESVWRLVLQLEL